MKKTLAKVALMGALAAGAVGVSGEGTLAAEPNQAGEIQTAAQEFTKEEMWDILGPAYIYGGSTYPYFSGSVLYHNPEFYAWQKTTVNHVGKTIYYNLINKSTGASVATGSGTIKEKYTGIYMPVYGYDRYIVNLMSINLSSLPAGVYDVQYRYTFGGSQNMHESGTTVTITGSGSSKTYKASQLGG